MSNSWKTTAIGCALAALQALQTYNGKNDLQGYAMAIALAALGFLSKDFNHKENK